ncbi:MAG: selenite/tellurite reduction operon c-type cytochrome lipoprotein ExtS [Geobacteraceae bacterium]
MGLRPAFLILLAGLLILPGADAFAGRVGCLQCHKPHYAEKGSCIGCHRGDVRSNRLAIAHHDLIQAKFTWFTIAGSQPLQRGEKLLKALACRRCHTASGKGNRLASNLDRLPTDISPQKIFDSIKSPALFMPNFYLNDRQIIDLVNVLLAGAAKTGHKGGEVPQVVRFEDLKQNTDNIFEKKCGSCHKIVTKEFGTLGRGEIGPNLSGLFTEFYPATFPGNRRWSEKRLQRWLKNPRTLLPNSSMRPVPLKTTETVTILRILR